MALIQEISTEDLAFNKSEKSVSRIFELNQKRMNPILAKVMRDEENPIKMLMTESFMEGYKVGNESKSKTSYLKGRASAFKESIEVLKNKETK